VFRLGNSSFAQGGNVHVFIDESGSFAGFHEGSISVVGALAIPDVLLSKIVKKYEKFRKDLPKENGEVKGRLLKEKQVDKIVTVLARNEAVFEVTALDLGLHNEGAACDYQRKLSEQMLAKVRNFRDDVRPQVQAASEYINKAPVNLFLQALTTFDVLHRVISRVTSFYAQRKPYELGSFSWIVDGKDPAKVTKWEEWWAHYAQGALATMSKRKGAWMLPAEFHADYSFYDKFSVTDPDGESGTSLKLLLKDIRFWSDIQAGLEFVDVLSNAVRRALTSKLQKEGWQNIHRLMIHENNKTCIQFVLFQEGGDVVHKPSYADVVHHGFTNGGRPMLTKKNMDLACDTEGSKPVIAV
jgi:hypothetical protein